MGRNRETAKAVAETQEKRKKMETEINTSDLAVISTRQRVCHICKHEGTLCDTREGEIVMHDGEILQVDELNTLVADFNGEPICEFCIAAQ